MWLHSLKVAQLLRSAACLHTNQSRSYLNHLVYRSCYICKQNTQLTLHSQFIISKHELFMLQRNKTFHLVQTQMNLQFLLSIILHGHFSSAETRRRWMPSHWPCRWMLFYCNCMSRVFGQLIINLVSSQVIPCLVQNGKVINLFIETCC